jgi:phosphoglycerate dehydrogenase-like enzyme
MRDVRVLEFVRDDGGIWSLPAETLMPLEQRFDGVRIVSPPDRAEADRLLPEAEIVLGWAVRRDNFATATRLRWVHATSAGIGPLLFPELVASPVRVSNARGMHADSMAEHAIGVLLCFARKLHLARDLQHQGRWGQRELVGMGPPFGSLEGATLGIVGYGAIGSAVGRRARALGMRVIGVRRRAPAGGDASVWGLERLDELLGIADAVVLATPLTGATRGLIGADALARMRPSAVLVNLGRGALVDEPALIAALESGRIAGAGLDVTAEEPLAESSPLWRMPQVILTPHVSGFGPRYWERTVELFAEHLQAYLAGEPLPNEVDKHAGY